MSSSGQSCLHATVHCAANVQSCICTSRSSDGDGADLVILVKQLGGSRLARVNARGDQRIAKVPAMLSERRASVDSSERNR
eukprot:6208044-Pleurochrysis_carterae.AAC.3